MKILLRAVAGGWLAVGSVACGAQQPKVTHAEVQVVSGGLQQAIEASHRPTWVGYALPVRHSMGTTWEDDVVYLEGGDHPREPVERKPGEPQPSTFVLLRVDGGKVQRVALEDPRRTLDGGGLPLVWVSSVPAAESVKVLTGVVEQASSTPAASGETDRVRGPLQTAVVAIALADTPAAIPALRGFTAERYPAVLRDRAAFWLANEGGREGLDAVVALLHSEKDESLREKLVFDLTLVKGDAKAVATDQLLTLAKSEPSPKVRGKAQFWLAQMASRKVGGDPRAAELLRDTAKNDPEIAMRKSAVFALSRLPEAQAVPELIQVASTSTDPSTRKEAIFWLGHKKDPRALAYLEKVIKE